MYGQSPPYFGGDNNGSENNCYKEKNNESYYFPFLGKNNDGFYVNCYKQEYTSHKQMFYGGISNGSFIYCYEQDVTPKFGIFNGGFNDGSGLNCYEQEYILHKQPFFGGFGNGNSFYCCEQEYILHKHPFFGGIRNGNNFYCYEQEYILHKYPFFGGFGNGSTLYCYEQDVIPLTGIYIGGSDDGFDNDCYSQTDYLIPVPIDLVSFEAQLINDEVELTWQTASEINNDYFIVQRSMDLTNWIYIDSVDGSGNSNELLNYKTFDRNPLDINYYRLKQVDFDGEYSYSLIEVISKIKNKNKKPEILVYPNPSSGKIFLQFSNFLDDNISVIMINNNNQKVYEKNAKLSEGKGIVELYKSYNLSRGQYNLIIQSKNNKFITRKIIFR